MSDYPYIRAWGRMMGSHRYYIDDQVALAKKNKAPHNALYMDGGGGGFWWTLDMIRNENTRDLIASMVKEQSA